MKTLGEKIRYMRLLKGWTQEDMADKLNISLPAYSKIERNITDINFSRLSQTAKSFGVSVVKLLSVNTKDLNDLKSKEEDELKKIIMEKDKEIQRLQKKIIELLEEE